MAEYETVSYSGSVTVATDPDQRWGELYSAVLVELTEVGYDRLTLDAVAARAHCSKATLYRHWSGKADVVASALAARICGQPALPDTGSLRGDLLAGLSIAVGELVKNDLPVLSAVLTAMQTDGQLAGLVRDQIVDAHEEVTTQCVRRAVTRGQLPPGTDALLVGEVTQPMLFFRLVITGRPVDATYLRHLVDDVVLPLLTCSGLARQVDRSEGAGR